MLTPGLEPGTVYAKLELLGTLTFPLSASSLSPHRLIGFCNSLALSTVHRA